MSSSWSAALPLRPLPTSSQGERLCCRRPWLIAALTSITSLGHSLQGTDKTFCDESFKLADGNSLILVLHRKTEYDENMLLP